MKVLVAYFSQTGNTEKVARAIFDEASLANEAELKKIENIEPGGTAVFDFIFVGAPLHAGNMAEPVKEFLKDMKGHDGQKLAGFITHAAVAYPDQEMDTFSQPLITASGEKNMVYKGCFDCQGFLTEALHEMIKNSQNLSDDQWAERVEQMTGHPDEEDLQKAKQFAGKVLSD